MKNISIYRGLERQVMRVTAGLFLLLLVSCLPRGGGSSQLKGGPEPLFAGNACDDPKSQKLSSYIDESLQKPLQPWMEPGTPPESIGRSTHFLYGANIEKPEGVKQLYFFLNGKWDYFYLRGLTKSDYFDSRHPENSQLSMFTDRRWLNVEYAENAELVAMSGKYINFWYSPYLFMLNPSNLSQLSMANFKSRHYTSPEIPSKAFAFYEERGEFIIARRISLAGYIASGGASYEGLHRLSKKEKRAMAEALKLREKYRSSSLPGFKHLHEIDSLYDLSAYGGCLAQYVPSSNTYLLLSEHQLVAQGGAFVQKQLDSNDLKQQDMQQNHPMMAERSYYGKSPTVSQAQGDQEPPSEVPPEVEEPVKQEPATTTTMVGNDFLLKPFSSEVAPCPLIFNQPCLLEKLHWKIGQVGENAFTSDVSPGKPKNMPLNEGVRVVFRNDYIELKWLGLSDGSRRSAMSVFYHYPGDRNQLIRKLVNNEKTGVLDLSKPLFPQKYGVKVSVLAHWHYTNNKGCYWRSVIYKLSDPSKVVGYLEGESYTEDYGLCSI